MVLKEVDHHQKRKKGKNVAKKRNKKSFLPLKMPLISIEYLPLKYSFLLNALKSGSTSTTEYIELDADS